MAFITRLGLRLGAVAAVSALAGALGTGAAFAYQGHMWSALHALQSADSALQQAKGDKGGYRLQAEQLIGQAISAVRAGIATGAA